MLLLSSAILFLISVWALAVFYTTYSNDTDVMKEITIQQVGATKAFNNFIQKTIHISSTYTLRA